MAQARDEGSPTTSTTRDETGVDRIFGAADVVESRERTMAAARSGRKLTLTSEPDGEKLTITAPGGAVELTVRLTREGPVVTIDGAALELTSVGALTIDCDRLALRARESAELACGGDLHEEVGGERSVVVGGRSSVQAHAASVEARRGNVEIKANDDVTLEGERIFLNR